MLVQEGVLVAKWFVLRTEGMLVIAWCCVQSLCIDYGPFAATLN